MGGWEIITLTKAEIAKVSIWGFVLFLFFPQNSQREGMGKDSLGA